VVVVTVEGETVLEAAVVVVVAGSVVVVSVVDVVLMGVVVLGLSLVVDDASWQTYWA